MKPTRTDLWLLLELMEGTIPSADREALRARIAGDKQLRQRWQQLNSVQPPAGNVVSIAEAISPDDIAAFLDGTLSVEDELAFEAHCWKSPHTLFELVSLASNRHEEVPISDSLVSRILDLSPMVRPDEEDVLPVIQVKISEPSARSRASGSYLIPVMLSTIAVLVAAVLWLALRDDDPNKLAKEENKTSAENQQVVEKDTPPKEQEEPQGLPKLNAPLHKPDGVAPPVIDDSPKIVDSPPTNLPMPDVPKPDEPEPLVPKPEPLKVASAAWETRGVVGVRASAREPWRGLDAVDRPVSAQFLTLPTSRAVTKS